MTTPDVIVVGGGPIGLSAAWRLAQRGCSVTVYDDSRPGRAYWAAAGMLTPVTEAERGEEPLLALSIESMRRWPDFADQAASATGEDIGFASDGVLAVGLDTDDLAVVKDVHDLHVEHRLGSEWLRSRECRQREPLLATNVRGGLFAEGDGAVDPRRLVPALATLATRAGVEVVHAAADSLVQAGDRVTGVEVDGAERHAGTVVLAAGAWSGADGLSTDLRPPVRPVYGEVIRLRVRRDDHVPHHVIRAVVHSRSVYIVARTDGEIAIGATSLDRGYDTRVTAGGVYDLLRDAILIVPALAEAEYVEQTAGLRPGTPDNAPIVGWSGVDGLYLATGHYRGGILLAPITADAVAAEVVGETGPAVIEACRPSRFVEDGVG